jgi:hypothetical protein
VARRRWSPYLVDDALCCIRFALLVEQLSAGFGDELVQHLDTLGHFPQRLHVGTQCVSHIKQRQRGSAMRRTGRLVGWKGPRSLSMRHVATVGAGTMQRDG